MIIVQAKAIPKDETSKNEIIGFAQDLIEKSREEAGNVDYNLLVNTDDDTLLFVEQWDSIEILNNHLKTEHFIKFGENIGDLVAEDLKISVFDANPTSL
ncbi:putative quinol monooxygenase [Methanobrevibacter sp.]|uniref:putative quinol monooxygenase n=1 Tax=Methanobrevibacter sp. TaxID=66852 RepID=UPI0026DEEBA9|nr:putative quinol monooxygenase [Methanobrevibacter sp.]MDO5823766.1 putative quinol monooxygenase [Methanobrevibacter sp.]